MKSDITFRTFKIGIRPTEGLFPILENENEILFPKDTFEAITSSFGEVSFSEALFATKEYGTKIARQEWKKSNESRVYVVAAIVRSAYSPNKDGSYDHKEVCYQTVLMYVDEGKDIRRVGWTPTQDDMFAEDWILLD